MIMLEIVIALTPSSMTGELKEAKQYKVSDEQYDQGAYIMLPSGWYSSSYIYYSTRGVSCAFTVCSAGPALRK
jgi:hypothetical protein